MVLITTAAGASGTAALAGREGWTGTAVAASGDPAAALASLHTGVTPWQHQLLRRDRGRLLPAVTTLAEALGERGYRTAAWAPRAVLGRGLARGFERVEEGASAGAVEWLEGAAPQAFLWLHLPSSGGGDADPAGDESLRALLDGLARTTVWQGAMLVVVGVPASPAATAGDGPSLDRTALERPLRVALPAGLGKRLRVATGERVAATRIWATVAEAAGVRAPPIVAPSLYRTSDAPILSELSLEGGEARFSLLAGGVRLLWAVPPDPAAGGRRHPGRDRASPLASRPHTAGEPLLERWTDGGVEPLLDASRTAAMAVELRRRAALFVVPPAPAGDGARGRRRRPP